MKRLLAALTVGLLSVCPAHAQFQLHGLPPISLPQLPVPLPAVALPSLPFTPGSAVSTGVTDTVPAASWLDLLEGGATPAAGHSFTVSPGSYRYTVQSYCLHAGTYGPSSGAGYALAPLMGDRAAVIRSVLQRSVSFPDIAQTDVQRLIWGIEAGTRFTDYPADFQARVLPLLSPADIAQSFVSLPALSGVLPGPLRDALGFYEQLRSELARPGASYAALERLAVLPGTAPSGAGSRVIAVGVWSAAGPGFYVRTIPSSYSRTVMDVIRVAPFSLTRDSRGRITRFSSGGYSIETTYDDAPGQDRLQEGEVSVPVWRFATLRLSGPLPGQSLSVSGRGFVVPSTAVRFGMPVNAWRRRPAAAQLEFARFQRVNVLFDTSLGAWRARAEAAHGLYERIQEYRGLYGRASARPSEQAIADFTDLAHYREGVQAAVQGEGLGWLPDHLLRQRAALEYATCVLAGDCAPPGEQPVPEQTTFDPTGFVATPGNTLMQRLGLSARELY